MRTLRPQTFIGEIEPGKLQVGSAIPRTVIFSDLAQSEVEWVRGLASPPARSFRTAAQAITPKDRLSERQQEILTMLDSVGLLAEEVNPLGNLRMRISGLDRIGSRIAILLAEEGAREIELRDRRVVDEVAPPAFTESEFGKRRQSVLSRYLRERYSGLRVGGLGIPDLAVICSPGVWDHGVLGRLLSEDIPHLPVIRRDHEVQVGPLIVPGVTGCAVCADLTVQDSYPLWAMSSLAIAAAPPPYTPAHMCLTAAGLAVMLINSAATGDAPSGAKTPTGVQSVSHSFTVGPTGVEVREWYPHPRCSCGIGPLTIPAPMAA